MFTVSRNDQKVFFNWNRKKKRVSTKLKKCNQLIIAFKFYQLLPIVSGRRRFFCQSLKYIKQCTVEIRRTAVRETDISINHVCPIEGYPWNLSNHPVQYYRILSVLRGALIWGPYMSRDVSLSYRFQTRKFLQTGSASLKKNILWTVLNQTQIRLYLPFSGRFGI